MKNFLLCFVTVLFAMTQVVLAGEIHDAVVQGDLATVESLVASDPELLTAPDDLGSTPLHIAAQNGHLNIVEFLLSKGVLVDIPDREKTTPLAVAGLGGHFDTGKFLIDMGADVNATDDNGNTPLLWAANGGNMQLFQLLLSKGADIDAKNNIGMSTLHYAAYGRHTDLVELLLDRGMDVNIKKSNDSTPLHGAALNGDLEVMNLLISRGADVNARNQAGYTPLLSAVAGSQPESVQLLLVHGADVNTKLVGGETALMESIPHDGENIDLAHLLIDKGVDVNAATNYGVTALMRASWWGKTETAKLLIANGADVNFKTKDRPPAILHAARGGYTEFVSLLIDNGAKLNVKDDQGATPLILAAIHGHEGVVRTLLAHGANSSYKDKNYGRTALHYSAIRGGRGVAEALIEGGASINRKDNEGKTALNYAAQYAHRDVADLLVAQEAVAYGDYEDNYGTNQALKRKVPNSEVEMWYLGHCGWAIKTQNHFLIFDYWNRGNTPLNPCLANGHINPEELKDQNVYVFVTHEHGDHYDTTIFNWVDKVRHITYVYGFRPEAFYLHRESGYHGPEYVYAGPHEHINIDGMDITTIQANDAGVGFLITVDGVTLFHAGDHAGWAEGQKEGFTREIDYLNERVDGVDLAFVNITGCHAHGPDQLWEGNCYIIEWLKPIVVVPTHAIDREFEYKAFADRVEREDLDVKIYCPENRGDSYHYKGKASL